MNRLSAIVLASTLSIGACCNKETPPEYVRTTAPTSSWSRGQSLQEPFPLVIGMPISEAKVTWYGRRGSNTFFIKTQAEETCATYLGEKDDTGRIEYNAALIDAAKDRRKIAFRVDGRDYLGCYIMKSLPTFHPE